MRNIAYTSNQGSGSKAKAFCIKEGCYVSKMYKKFSTIAEQYKKTR